MHAKIDNWTEIMKINSITRIITFSSLNSQQTAYLSPVRSAKNMLVLHRDFLIIIKRY